MQRSPSAAMAAASSSTVPPWARCRRRDHMSMLNPSKPAAAAARTWAASSTGRSSMNGDHWIDS